MSSSISFPIDDKDLDDAELWAVIDSAAASHSSSKTRKALAVKHANGQSFNPRRDFSSPPIKGARCPRSRPLFDEQSRASSDGEVLQESWMHQPPQKMSKSFSDDNRIVLIQRTPPTSFSSFSSPACGDYPVQNTSPIVESPSFPMHSLSGKFPSVSLFKQYQNAALAILEKTDYTVISGHHFIKKSGWRKISCFFNMSYEIKDKTIEFDDNRNVQRAEFVVRAFMQGGRFSDGWGSCERREKRFLKPNHDVPSTAETRAKNKACQDLLGIGEYRPGSSNAH